MKVFNNIEFIQVNLFKTQDRYYLPENSAIFDKKIDEIAIYVSDGAISPIDGTPLINPNILSNFYIDVVKASKETLHKDVSCSLSVVDKNFRLPINAVISPNLTSIFFVGANTEDIDGKCLLLYVTYQNDNKDVQLTNNQVSVTLNSQSRIFTLSSVIDYYLLQNFSTCKGIEIVYNEDSDRFYCDFKCFDKRSFRYVPSDRMVANADILPHTQVNRLFLNDFSFDFDNCFIINSESEIKGINAKMIFYY